ncbi:cupin domain-containing protein [Dictyobacter formicarum]|uniref:Cupin type-2 domain-containing protein n=1 Tax=Dictyobacter formicarum TaxID=2778368 RepID=A0ABQ3VDE4_9CHLR|nr:cupin domain-containing protein [Dictyobacter formicarum]GHO83779.1 hypothetical protein KSZ_17850 [Dictyobacter formicarum]
MTEHNIQHHQTVPYTRNLRDACLGDELQHSYYLAQKEDTAGQLTLNEAIIERGQEPPPHTHTREDEAFYLLDGAATFYVGEQTFSASPGTFTWLPRNIQHSFRIDSARARFLIFILPAGLELFFAQMAQLFQQEQVQPGQISPEAAHKWQQLSQQFGITLNP